MRRRRAIAGLATALALAVAGCFQTVRITDDQEGGLPEAEEDVRGCTRDRCLRGSEACCPEARPGMWYVEYAWCSCFGAADADADRADTARSCVPACDDDLTCCPVGCVDLASDPDNCGACGSRCLDDDPPLADSCVDSGGRIHCSCDGSVSKCRRGQTCCPDGCRSTEADPNNCGACGNVCPYGEICREGRCCCGYLGVPCPAGDSCCSGACVPTNSDVENCGGCGIRCDRLRADACVDGVCRCGTGAACVHPVVCDESATDERCCAGVCRRFGTAEACNACDTPCPDGRTCVADGSAFPPCTWVCE